MAHILLFIIVFLCALLEHPVVKADSSKAFAVGDSVHKWYEKTWRKFQGSMNTIGTSSIRRESKSLFSKSRSTTSRWLHMVRSVHANSMLHMQQQPTRQQQQQFVSFLDKFPKLFSLSKNNTSIAYNLLSHNKWHMNNNNNSLSSSRSADAQQSQYLSRIQTLSQDLTTTLPTISQQARSQFVSWWNKVQQVDINIWSYVMPVMISQAKQIESTIPFFTHCVTQYIHPVNVALLVATSSSSGRSFGLELLKKGLMGSTLLGSVNFLYDSLRYQTIWKKAFPRSDSYAMVTRLVCFTY